MPSTLHGTQARVAGGARTRVAAGSLGVAAAGLPVAATAAGAAADGPGRAARPPTAAERDWWLRRIGALRYTKGYGLLWRELPSVRSIVSRRPAR